MALLRKFAHSAENRGKKSIKTKICNKKIVTRLTNRSMAGFTFGASGFHDSKAFRVATLEDNSSGLKVNILKWT